MNVIALISGGKDSVFSILHCLAKGHRVVALANLNPVEDALNQEDIDSYMYQTVGHTVIPLYQEALGLPLHRAPIQGSTVNTQKYYQHLVTDVVSDGSSRSDETESLLHLLQKVKDAHPEADAVSTGAILSDYQRSRVESVAIRLGLQSLAFLWQYPYLPPYTQTSLLEDMAVVGHEAVIIKIASGGLDDSVLGKNVADTKTIMRLKLALERFGPLEGGSVLGEGGEYETLSLSGPSKLWRKKIEIDEDQNQIMAGQGGTAILNIQKPKVVPILQTLEQEDWSASLRVPNGLDEEFKQLTLHFSSFQKLISPILQEAINTKPISAEVCTSIHRTPYTLHINNLSAPSTSQLQPLAEAEQLNAILLQLSSILNEYKAHTSQIFSTTLLLRSMSSFTTLNPIYGSYFSQPLPPSRITVSCGDYLPPSISVTLSVVVNLQAETERKGLHVQSISYWAPANIGPYSQAMVHEVPAAKKAETEDDHEEQRERVEIVHMAGQIPLVPETMALVNEGNTLEEFNEQTVLALQHLWRVGRAVDVGCWIGGMAFIAKEEGDVKTETKVRVVLEAWKYIHEQMKQSMDDEDEDEDEEEVVDVWDQKYGNHRHKNLETSSRTLDTRRLLPDISRMSSQGGGAASLVPPCFVAEVEELPRGAQVEWTSFGLVNGDLEIGLPKQSGDVCEHISCRVTQTDGILVWVALNDTKSISLKKLARDLLGTEASSASCTIYAAVDLPKEFHKEVAMQVIPCRSVWSFSGEAIDVMVVFRIDGPAGPKDM